MKKTYCLLLLLFATQSSLPYCLADDGGPILRPPIDTNKAQSVDASDDSPQSPPASNGSAAPQATDIRPSPTSSLEELYPQSANKTPYAASSNDPSLTEKQKKEAEQVPIAPIPVSELLPIGNGKLPPIQLEASFNEPISLKRVLEITLENSLPIRISQAGFDSQRYLFYGALGGFIPSLTTTYRGQKTDNGRTVNTLFSDSTTVTYPVFQGGRVTYNAYANLYRTRAAKQQYFATVNDALLESYRSYYNLLLNQTLLQIRVKSVELSRTQLKLNEQLKAAGVGTNFAIYQSRTQLALDKQALLQQQVLVRTSALALARVLNQSMVINFIPQEKVVRELRLIDANVDIEQITDAALRMRPELKQFENLRMAANRQVQVNASGFYPSMQFFTSLTKSKSTSAASNGASGAASASNNALSGSTVIIPTGGSGGGIGISGSGGRSVSAGFDLTWSIPNMGVPIGFNTLSARALARQALLQSNQQYLLVMEAVRASYLNMLTAKEQVKVAAEAVVSGTEQLRLANLRVAYGQGINLELIQAQQAYVTALTNHVQAVINYNIAQAQLLRDSGQISLETLTKEYNQPISLKKPDNNS